MKKDYRKLGVYQPTVDNSGTPPTKMSTLESIEDTIITALNDADEQLSVDEFVSLSESTISYIDELSRSKK